MNPTTEQHVRLTLEDIFHAASELPPDERAAYLNDVCADRPDLRRKAGSMLQDYEDDDFLETPAVEDALKEIAKQKTEQMAQQPRELMIGRQIGNYRILALLGKGGMGEVYLAHDNDLDVDVAIKFLIGTYADDPEWQARFNREGRLNADLTHQNIAGLRHKGQCDGRPFLVFEYVPGQTLADKLENGPLPVKEALPIFQQLAAGLAHAHSKRIIHRDLKPANIKITPDGQVKILDFGIARRITTDLATVEMKTLASDEQLTRDFGETIQGEVIGTVVYMSPEQTRGEMLDAGTDIWSLACVMYQTLTCRLPFKGVDTYDTLNLIRDPRHEPDWSALPANTPKTIQQLFRQCFAKQRAGRRTSAEDVRQTIALTIKPSRLWPQQFKHQLMLVTGVSVLLIAAFFSGAWLRSWWVRSAVPAEKQFVVLPFKGFGDEQAGVGFADDLRRNLMRVSDAWQSVPASDVRSANLLNLDLQNISRKLGANLIVSGEVQQTGAQLKIKFRVQNSFLYTLEEGEVSGISNQLAALQNQIAERVADKLNLAKSARAAAYSQQLQVSSYQATEQYLIAIGELQKVSTTESVEKPIEILTRLIQTEGDSARLQSALARAYLNKYVFTQAPDWAEKSLQSATQAVNLSPDQPDVYQITRGLVYLEKGDYEESLKDFEAALERNPRDWEALNGAALAHRAARRFQRAEQIYTQMIEWWPRYWDGYNELAGLYVEQRDFDKAIKNCQQVISLLPDSTIGYICLASAYQQTDQQTKAIDNYLIAISKDQTRESLEARTSLGSVYFEQQQYDLALTYSQQALEIAKETGREEPRVFSNLADAYRQLARMQTLPNLESEYSRHSAEMYDSAISLCQRNVEASVNANIDELTDLAEWLAKRGRITEAMPYLVRAIKSDPQFSDVAYSATIVYLLAGDTTRSLYWLERLACGGYNVARLNSDPELQDLRRDSRYESIVAKCRSVNR
ncbi:MAG: protein kinase domain-containing protein [Blastocatellia bacterium]